MGIEQDDDCRDAETKTKLARMNIGKTLHVNNRKEWRSWLAKNHASAREIWLIFYKKHTGKSRIPYNDAVEEALCYGWIDSIVKTLDDDRTVQRFSPRRKNSRLSPMNKERVRRLIKSKKMTRYGLESIQGHLKERSANSNGTGSVKDVRLPKDILATLRADPVVWANFRKFPQSYKRIRVGWIDGARKRPAEFKKRLNYFVRMTAKNKRFGMVQ